MREGGGSILSQARTPLTPVQASAPSQGGYLRRIESLWCVAIGEGSDVRPIARALPRVLCWTHTTHIPAPIHNPTAA
jgi:hypothetical protein